MPLLPILSSILLNGLSILLMTLGPLLAVALLEVVEDVASLVEVMVVLVHLVAVVLNGVRFAIVTTTLMPPASIALSNHIHTFSLHNPMPIFHIHHI